MPLETSLSSPQYKSLFLDSGLCTTSQTCHTGFIVNLKEGGDLGEGFRKRTQGCRGQARGRKAEFLRDGSPAASSSFEHLLPA